MQKRARKHYSKEFKIDTVKLITEKGMKVSEVSRDLGITKELLYRWKKEYEQNGANSFPGEGKMSLEEEELRKLRRKLANVKEERNILKKAIAIFSKTQNQSSNL